MYLLALRVFVRRALARSGLDSGCPGPEGYSIINVDSNDHFVSLIINIFSSYPDCA